MYPKRYPIRPKQAYSYLMSIIMPIAYVVSCFMGFVIMDLPFSVWQKFMMALGVGFLFCFLARLYFKPKIDNIALIIDDKGIRTNARLLNKLPNSNPILFKDIDRVDYTENLVQEMFGKHLSKTDPYLKDFNKALIVHASKKDKFGKTSQKFMIAQNVWQIDDFDDVVSIFIKHGHTPKFIDNQSYIKANNPQLQDLGKRSGHLAYSSLFLLILMGVLFYIDKFITLDFGHISTIYFGVAILVAVAGFYYIYRENKQVQGSVSLIIFVPMATLFLLSVMLLLSPWMGQSHLVQFNVQGNKWQTQFNNTPIYVECKQKPILSNDKANEGKVNIIQTLGMIRISFDEIHKICHNGKFIKSD